MAASSVGVRLVGDHDHLGGAGEGRRDADTALLGDLPLGDGHIGVARTDDDVDLADRLGAVGHRRDGLGSADGVDLVDIGEGGGGQGRGIDGPIPIGGNAQHHLRHSRHPGRDGRHQHRRGVPGPAAGHVQTGPVDRSQQVGHDEAFPLVGPLRGQRAALKALDRRPGRFEGVAERRRDGGEGGVHGRPGHSELVEDDAIERLGERADGGIATLFDLGQDVPNGRHRTLAVERRARQVTLQVTGHVP